MEVAKEKMIISSYGSWQIIETVKGLLSEKAKGVTFQDHLKRLGLSEKTTKEDSKTKQARKNSALTTAEEIKAIDRQLRDKGAN